MKKVLPNFMTTFRAFSYRLAHYQTILVIVLFYFLILSPIGLLFKLFGWDPLKGRGFSSTHKNSQTNWEKSPERHNDISSMRRLS